MPVFAVKYTYTTDADLRNEHRPAHREWLKALYDSGELLATGAFADSDGALLIWRYPNKADVLAVLPNDPFAKVGAIAATDVYEWNQVYSPWAQ